MNNYTNTTTIETCDETCERSQVRFTIIVTSGCELHNSMFNKNGLTSQTFGPSGLASLCCFLAPEPPENVDVFNGGLLISGMIWKFLRVDLAIRGKC